MMLGNVDFKKVQDQYEAFWERRNQLRPLILLSESQNSYHESHPAFQNITTEKQWLDVQAIYERNRIAYQNTRHYGESFPLWNINFGPDILGAVLGCDLQFAETTSWSTPFVKDWDEHTDIAFDPQNHWWKKLMEFTEFALKQANGEYFVGITDLHPGGDGVCAIRGVSETLIDLTEDPQRIKEMTFKILPVFKEMVDRTYALTAKYGQKGSANWTGLWHPGKFYVTSCDMCCMISPAMFDDYILPELAAESDYLDASIYHLDGPGAVQHLDSLLSIDSLNGIQFVPGDGSPPAGNYIPMFKKIQAAGKVVQTICRAHEAEAIYDAFKDDPRGICLVYNCKNAQEIAHVAAVYGLE